MTRKNLIPEQKVNTLSFVLRIFESKGKGIFFNLGIEKILITDVTHRTK